MNAYRGPPMTFGNAAQARVRSIVAVADAWLVVVFTLLAGCSQPLATGRPQLGAPATGDNTSLSVPGAVGAGSFPRSFLIPGTNTSIRVGG